MQQKYRFFSKNSSEDEGSDLNTRILFFQMGGDYLPTIDDDLGCLKGVVYFKLQN